MLEGRCRAQSCRPRRLKVTAGSRGSWPQKATVSVDYAFPTIPPTTDQSASVTSIVVLLPRPPYGNRPRSLEAYRRYGLRPASGTTNLSVFRSLVRTYPDRDHRRILLDLIEPAATRANGSRPRNSLGFSTSLSSVPPRKAQTHRRWSEQPEISAAKSRNSPPLSRCLLSRPFSLAGAMTQACRKSTTP